MILTRDLGIDLGTENTRICDKKMQVTVNEPSVVAVDVKTRRVLATGSEARNMIGKTPGSIVSVRPLTDGVIADFDMTVDMLHDFMSRASKYSVFTRTRVVITVPGSITEVERRAVEDAVRAAGAQDVELLEETMAAALGLGLPVYSATGSMVIDIGGGTTDIAVMSLGGIAASKSIGTAGEAFNRAIINYMQKEHELVIGELTAENIKLKIGSVMPYDGEGAVEVRGRNATTGLPGSIEVTSGEIREVLLDAAGDIINAIRETLSVTLPELSADIADKGIYLTGGSSQLRGLTELIEEETGIPVHIANNPLECAVKGAASKLRKAK